MTDTKAIAFLEKQINDSKEFVERIEKAKIKYSMVSHGYVVWNPVTGMPMSFDFKSLPGGRRQAIGGGSVGVLFAERYTKADAETLGANTLCGPDKVPAVAMFINDAIDLTIASQNKLIEQLESYRPE